MLLILCRLLTPGRVFKDQPPSAHTSSPSHTSSPTSQQSKDGLHKQRNGKAKQALQHDSQPSQADEPPQSHSSEELNHSNQHVSNPIGQPDAFADSVTQPLSADTSSATAQITGHRPQLPFFQPDSHKGISMLLCILSLMPRYTLSSKELPEYGLFCDLQYSQLCQSLLSISSLSYFTSLLQCAWACCLESGLDLVCQSWDSTSVTPQVCHSCCAFEDRLTCACDYGRTLSGPGALCLCHFRLSELGPDWQNMSTLLT